MVTKASRRVGDKKVVGESKGVAYSTVRIKRGPKDKPVVVPPAAPAPVAREDSVAVAPLETVFVDALNSAPAGVPAAVVAPHGGPFAWQPIAGVLAGAALLADLLHHNDHGSSTPAPTSPVIPVVPVVPTTPPVADTSHTPTTPGTPGTPGSPGTPGTPTDTTHAPTTPPDSTGTTTTPPPGVPGVPGTPTPPDTTGTMSPPTTTTAPEPASFVLVGTGLAALALAKRKRVKH